MQKKKQEKKNILKYLKLNQEKINEFIKTIEPSAMGENDPPNPQKIQKLNA